MENNQKKPCPHKGAKRGVGQHCVTNMDSGGIMVIATFICEDCNDVVTIAYPINLPNPKPPVGVPRKGIAVA